MTRHLAAILAFASLIACSKSAEILGPSNGPANVYVDGPLRITTSDRPSMMGVMFVRPSSVGGVGSVTATGIRYGSVCRLGVIGHADIAANVVTLHIAYVTRPDAACTTDVRAITYDAVVSGLAPGQYDVRIMQTTESSPDEYLIGDDHVTVR